MVDSRQKGARFENDVCKRINDFMMARGSPVRVRRNLEQYQISSQCDIELPNFAIECKEYKDGCWYQNAWWDQVLESCGEKIPVLIWKFNNKPPRVVVPTYFLNDSFAKNNSRTVVMSLDEWLNNIHMDPEFYFPQQFCAACED